MSMIEFSRMWAMPNKNTFNIKPIRAFLLPYVRNAVETCDPFCGDSTIGKYRNDIQKSGMDSLEWMKQFKDGSMDIVLFDAPYSPRQLKECYNSMGQSLHDTKSSVWKNWKMEIARLVRPGGYALSFGWSSGGMGKQLGFDIEKILLVPHGGNHHDTICVAEKKKL